jgi:predicted phosphoribosyltransferase
MPPLFRDRSAGGRALAAALGGAPLDHSVVVGVARGGVAVAAEVARSLRAPLTAVDVERVNSHGLRLGAATADAPAYLLDAPHVPAAAIEAALKRARREAEAVEARMEHERVPVAGRTAVVVDDGVVTGLTLAAACRWARSEQAAAVVAVTPVGRIAGLTRIREEADDVVCAHPLDELTVVGQAYEIFDPLDEWYVAGLLQGR